MDEKELLSHFRQCKTCREDAARVNHICEALTRLGVRARLHTGAAALIWLVIGGLTISSREAENDPGVWILMWAVIAALWTAGQLVNRAFLWRRTHHARLALGRLHECVTAPRPMSSYLEEARKEIEQEERTKREGL